MLIALLVVLTVTAAYWFPIRRWMNQWLDRLFGYLDRPSADRILPEFQQLAVGARIPRAVERAEALRDASAGDTRSNRRPAA